MNSVVNRDEVRRLEKAARDKNKKKLADWIKNFETYIDSMVRRDYAQACQDEIVQNFDNIIMAVAYTAYFSEESYVDNKNIADFMSDLFATIDMYRTGEYTPSEYTDILKKDGVQIDNYDSDLIYKKYLNIFDTDLVRFLKTKPSKLITICGNSKHIEDILRVNADLSLRNYIVFMDGVIDADNKLQKEEIALLEQLKREKISMSDAIYVVNKDGFMDDTMRAEIKYAEEHNKEIIYMESID